MPNQWTKRPVSIEERFWSKVEFTDTCWLWTANINQNGYGMFQYRTRCAMSVHRLAYRMLVGEIPVGLVIDHLCRVRNCVNPAHMETVTMRENTLRGETLPALNIRKTHCPQGHPYSAENTYYHFKLRSPVSSVPP